MSHNENTNSARLRNRVIRELNRQGYRLRTLSFLRNGETDKEFIRARHVPHRKERLSEEFEFLKRSGRELLTEFADGSEIAPHEIAPTLIPVNVNTSDSDLFRFASLLWSVPTSRGYGRRMRYLIRDLHNGKLMGLLALGDPVFNLSARDDWIGWSAELREQRLVNMMDAYVLGAVPPYNHLLCGKLIALLATSREISSQFRRKYGQSKGIISGESKSADLAMITTTSALGRSSIYNRLTLPGSVRFQRIGMTKGYGHFHLPSRVFAEVRQYMEEIDHPYASAHKFGKGPNWRMRLIRAAFNELRIDEEVLKHGIAREVYVVALAKNSTNYLLGKSKRLRRINLPAREIVSHCLKRWIIPRSYRDSRFRSVTRSDIAAQVSYGSQKVINILRCDD